jgi:HEAT repeat protein
MGRVTDEVVAALAANLKDEDRYVASSALETMASFAPQSQAAFNEVLKARASPHRDVRAEARNHIAIVGNKAPILLVKSLESSDAEIRFRAFQAIYSDVELDAKVAVPALIRGLTDEDERVRHIATNAICNLDPEAANRAGFKIVR